MLICQYNVLRKCVSNGSCLSQRWYRMAPKRIAKDLIDSSNDGFSDEERSFQIETHRIKIEFQPLYDLPDYYLMNGKPQELTNNQWSRHDKRLRTGFSIKEAFVQVDKAERVDSQVYLTKATLLREQKSYAISKNVSNYITDLYKKKK